MDAHKGTMGQAALFAGSYGMAGAAILSGRACLRSGVGKLTCFTDERTYPMLQVCMPEAVFRIRSVGENAFDGSGPTFDAVGVGPGIGTGADGLEVLSMALKMRCPIVLDADALNLIAQHRRLSGSIPGNAVLTPHGAEYARLFGTDADPAEVSRRLGCILVMKGPNTRIHAPDGGAYRNTTGNPGMATAGSGDVLTGMILGLLARGYPPFEAACLGVFLHGRSGDLAARSIGQESLIASDLTDHLGPAFGSLRPSAF